MLAFEELFRRLNDGDVRYVVVGGVAVVLHGVMRFTADIDLIIDLAPAAAQNTMNVMTSAGFVPHLPLAASEFADERKRRMWISEKNMTVFSMLDRHTPPTVVDFFAESPIDFETLWTRATIIQLETTTVRVASIGARMPWIGI